MFYGSGPLKWGHATFLILVCDLLSDRCFGSHIYEIQDMDQVYEELDDAKAEIERLKAELRSKTDSLENLKKFQNAQFNQIQEAKLKIEKLDQELLQKADEVTEAKQNCEDLKRNLNKKESIIKHLSAANDKLRVDCDEKFKKWEDEKKGLVLALEEANEKAENQEQQIHVYRQEIESLKGCLSVSKRNLEVKKKSEASRELRERDDMFQKLEEENRKVAEQLKWKKEQFKHLEEAHEKVRQQFKSSKKEWDLEKSTLLDEISSLQMKLDSQIRTSENLQMQLKICSQALAHEESRRKHLEVQVSDYKLRFENVTSEYEDARFQLDHFSSQRDKDIGDLRYSLKTKEGQCKELKYAIGKLEQENQELRMSLKELQEAQIQEAGAAYSQSKLRSKLRNLEQIHRDCASTLNAKEFEWKLQLEKLTRHLNDYQTELMEKTEAIEELKMELESSHSSNMQLKLLNEEMSVMLLVLKEGISEAQMKLANDRKEMLEESTKCQLLLKERISQIKSDSEERIKEISDALDRTNTELLERIYEGNEIEFELQIWKSIVERLKNDLEENHVIRKELENSLLAQVDFAVTLKQEKESLIYKLEEKDKIIEELQKEVVIAKRSMGRTYGHQKKLDMVELMHQVSSLGQQFTTSSLTFSSQLAEKQVEINLIQDACDKIAAAEILALHETEEKKLIIAELEDDIHEIEKKLKLQEESWSQSEQLALEIEAEMEAKQLKVKGLTDQIETKLKSSDALYHKLKMENRKLLDNVTKLSSERENLLCFIMALDEKICEFSTADTQLMNMLGSVVHSFENDCPGLKKEDGFLTKENAHSPMGTKKLEAISDARSPFKELNN